MASEGRGAEDGSFSQCPFPSIEKLLGLVLWGGKLSLDGCCSFPSHRWVSASTSDFLSPSVSLGASLPFGPSFSFDLSRVEATSQDITFPCTLF